ncbi:MAG: arylsulfotransferase family protein, partial [Polyangiaceae bacterium]
MVLASALLAVACSRASPSTSDQGPAYVATTLDAGTSSDGGAPLVMSLSTSPLPLTPAFSPAIHDYYVRCAAGRNAVDVTATADADTTVALIQPTTTPPAAAQNLILQLSENQAIVVRGSSGAQTGDYWVRCLPHDFPRLSMVSHPDAGAPTPGYYLIGDTSSASGESSYAMVVDGNGVPVWYSTTTNGNQPMNVESLATNAVSFVAFFDYTLGETSGQYEIHSLANGPVSFVEPMGEPLDVHELQLLPNGDYLVLSDPVVSGVDLTGLSSFGPNEWEIGCNVQEVTPAGAVVWQWDADDHFDPVKDCTYPVVEGVENITAVDPYHCNSIDVDPSGDLLISSRHMDSVFLVSKATGNVVWKMGGATYTKDGAVYLAVTDDPQGAFYRQHDARFLGNGQISLFDDATDAPGPARGVVYSYDPSAGTASFVWQYTGTVTSAAMGSFRVLADGSRIIGWGEGGEPQLAFTEVDASGNDL